MIPTSIIVNLLAPIVAIAAQGAPVQSVPPIVLPTVVVTAQKQPVEAQRLPVSVTAITDDLLTDAGIGGVAEAAAYSPNTRVAELSARKISNAFIRGIGSSPSNPGITTFLDGVPQLSSNSSNIELLEVEQIEFVRGPQSALFGRNTLGGFVSVASVRPSLSKWTGRIAVPVGSAGARDVRGSVSGPVGGAVAVGLSAGHSQRDGYTTNDLTGHAIDSRSASFGKAQLLWVPAPAWEVRLIADGERARDGDYALGDLGELRRRPFHVARDFEGRTDRDIWSTTALLRHEGRRMTVSSTTGYVSWATHDLTDLDYSPMPLMQRDNAEHDYQYTQELRLASAPDAHVRPGDGVAVSWQTGLFLFSQRYTQDAVNNFAPGVLSPYLMFAVSQHSPQAALDDSGLGVYGQGTLTVRKVLDLTAGARFDSERKKAVLDTYYAPTIAPPTHVDTERTFSDVSPQASAALRLAQDKTIYVSVGRGFKAGGFNPASPASSAAYGEEHAWNVEGGAKTTWASGRLSANVAVFRIDWKDMQLNVPNPQVPGQFYIANVGGARSSGLEIEVKARPLEGVDVMAGLGVTRAHFGQGSTSGGADVSGHELPNTPGVTFSIGGQYSRKLGTTAKCFGRADAVFSGAYHYDEGNVESQAAYWLANVRAGAETKRFIADVWVKNVFDTKYVPVAFAYANLAPSGYLGENGHPRTFGISLGMKF